MWRRTKINPNISSYSASRPPFVIFFLSPSSSSISSSSLKLRKAAGCVIILEWDIMQINWNCFWAPLLNDITSIQSHIFCHPQVKEFGRKNKINWDEEGKKRNEWRHWNGTFFLLRLVVTPADRHLSSSSSEITERWCVLIFDRGYRMQKRRIMALTHRK